MDDLPQAAGDMIGNRGFEMLHLNVDLQFGIATPATRHGGMPTDRNQIALGKQFQNPGHHARFGSRMNGKTIYGCQGVGRMILHRKGML